MTALRHNPLHVVSAPGLLIPVCATLLYGCLGGPGSGPKLGWQDEETVTLTVSAGDADPHRGMAGSGEDPEVADAGTGNGPSAPVDNPQPPESRPVSDRAATADDSVRCGDGHLDQDELCDIAIADGEDGACPTDCGKDPCAKLDVHGCMTACVSDDSDPECPHHMEADAGSAEN
jgi:hypothetical protein